MEKTFEERKKEHLDYLASLPKKVVIHGAVNPIPETPVEEISEESIEEVEPVESPELVEETDVSEKLRNFTPLEIVRLGKAIGDMTYEEMDKVLEKSDGTCDSICKLANTPEFRRNISKRLEREEIIKGLKENKTKRL